MKRKRTYIAISGCSMGSFCDMIKAVLYSTESLEGQNVWTNEIPEKVFIYIGIFVYGRVYRSSGLRL